MNLNRRFIAAATFASFGLLIGVATADFGAGGVAAPQNDGEAARSGRSAERIDPADRLETVRGKLEISPEQEAAWRRYAEVTLSLAGERREFDRRLSSGATRDDGSEYWRHQLVLAAAIGDLKSHLSPAQNARLAPLIPGLAETLTCGGLARSETANVR